MVPLGDSCARHAHMKKRTSVAEATTQADVLRKTGELLVTTQRGLRDLIGSDPTVRTMGLYNVAVFGRSVTLALQNLRTLDRQGFDDWYTPFASEMAEDSLMKYFTNLRNEILKEGPPRMNVSFSMENLDSETMNRLMKDPPPGATGFFMGDQRGGSGWDIELPDGTTTQYYVQLPPDLQVEVSLHLPDPPTEHRSEPLADTSAIGLSTAYVEYLGELVQKAESHFAS